MDGAKRLYIYLAGLHETRLRVAVKGYQGRWWSGGYDCKFFHLRVQPVNVRIQMRNTSMGSDSLPSWDRHLRFTDDLLALTSDRYTNTAE